MNSMTGHGRGEHLQNGYKTVVELAGVNRKQLEIGVSLPGNLSLWGRDSRAFAAKAFAWSSVLPAWF